MKKIWRVVEHIYEGKDNEPVLTHVFYGETPSGAWAIRRAHMQTDSFLKSCATDRRFRDFTCHTSSYVERLNARGEWVRAG